MKRGVHASDRRREPYVAHVATRRTGSLCAGEPLALRGRAGARFGRPNRGCVGISEDRGFGACVNLPYRCDPTNAALQLGDCGERFAGGGYPCACMLLAPALLEEFADHGWAVSQQTCLAYREHFPGQVRCMDATWTEL